MSDHWLVLLVPGRTWPGVAVCALVPLCALLIDQWLGEPPVAWHPVVWMGKALQWGGERVAPTVPVAGDFKRFWLAALIWCVLAATIFIAYCWLQYLVLSLHALLAVACLGLLLKPLLSWRMLRDEVLAVEVALAQTLPAGRAQLSRLVSRDVSGLTAVQVRESAIESLAENLNDSVVAPMFWFAVLGLPGAALYRFANTADAMWGYPGMRSGRYWQWAGKWAARADDVLSWVPARITGVLLLAGCKGHSLAALARQARHTPSPNSGWPMAAMALALDVRLAKPHAYTLHAAGRVAAPLDTRRAARRCAVVVWAMVPIALVLQVSLAVIAEWVWA